MRGEGDFVPGVRGLGEEEEGVALLGQPRVGEGGDHGGGCGWGEEQGGGGGGQVCRLQQRKGGRTKRGQWADWKEGMVENDWAGKTTVFNVQGGDHGGGKVGVEAGDFLLFFLLQGLQIGAHQLQMGKGGLAGGMNC